MVQILGRHRFEYPAFLFIRWSSRSQMIVCLNIKSASEVEKTSRVAMMDSGKRWPKNSII